LAHFLRHSNGFSQRTQIFGAKPFFVLATRIIQADRASNPSKHPLDHFVRDVGC
jgi:hypothetical protein